MFKNYDIWLTSKKTCKPLTQYALHCFPLENNILFNFKGLDISLSYKNNLFNSAPEDFCNLMAKKYSSYCYGIGRRSVQDSVID